ncbi:proline iminopeptidase [Mycolicibacterium murale]|uniref:Proline iminopeptidase n=1 Tax=Mycolicibacterium murale TaxID=182220 RepID=A0A7I9WF42_9MYCO|nr:prolyl aminopeptidase [Mycolicibacterium murale]GFG55866.1 proline iminopeptidase [Mycolicibacterium murale]
MPLQPSFPEVPVHDCGLLDVGDGNHIYWEVRGNPTGLPVLVVHDGPGAGRPPGAPKAFDPQVFRIILFDQRGCGDSVPSAADPATNMAVNTTGHLLADMEALREHLHVDRWLLYGGSWASTLILAYAQRHPDRVHGIVAVAVTLTQPDDIDWRYHSLRQLLPLDWERFRAGVPTHQRGGNLVHAYHQLMNDPDPAVRRQAAHDWCAWQDAAVAHENPGNPGPYSTTSEATQLAFARISTHYLAHAAWLEDRQILRNTHRLNGIPGILLHGRLDLACPLRSAWELAQAWPDAELTIIDDAGHTGSPTLQAAIFTAVATFSTLH